MSSSLTSPRRAALSPVLEIFAISNDELFRPADVELIQVLDYGGWAASENVPLDSDDRKLLLDELPAATRAYLNAEASHWLAMPVIYACPLYYYGRIVTYAVFPGRPPQAQQPIEVTVKRAQPLPVPQSITAPAPAPRALMAPEPKRKDPPVPIPVLGLLNREDIGKLGKVYREFLTGGQNALTLQRMEPEILMAFARGGQATRSEVFYFLTVFRSLMNGAWMQEIRYRPLLEIEWLLEQEGSYRHLVIQRLVHEHLIQEQPIKYNGFDPHQLEITLPAN